MPKAFYRRKLPHLQRDGKPHFLTFCTHQRWILPEAARDVALGCCLHDNDRKIDISAVVVMPDHVHMIFTPLVNEQAGEVYTLREIMDAIKGASAHKINRQLGRTGKLWQAESYDRVLRSSGKLDEKIKYILKNPVRKGLASACEEYRWLWSRDLKNPYKPDPPTQGQPPSAFPRRKAPNALFVGEPLASCARLDSRGRLSLPYVSSTPRDTMPILSRVVFFTIYIISSA